MTIKTLLLPTLRRFAQFPFRRLLAEFDTARVRVRDICKNATRECAWRSGFADHQAALPESCGSSFYIRRFQSKVVQSGRPLRVRLLKFDERVTAHLDIS